MNYYNDKIHNVNNNNNKFITLVDTNCKLPENGLLTPKHVGSYFNINFMLLICAYVGMIINIKQRVFPNTATTDRSYNEHSMCFTRVCRISKSDY
jgi:hypothetical protein